MEKMTFDEFRARMIPLYQDGKFAAALQLIDEHAGRFPEQSARTTYWRMCMLSRDNRPDEALAVFRQGLDSGLWWAEETFADPDLNAVRDLPEFKRLVSVSKEKHKQAQGYIERDQTVLVPEPPPSAMYPLLIALHGHNGDKDVHIPQWEVAQQRGWLVLSVQSTQVVFPGAYHWDDTAQGLADLQFYYEQIAQKYTIDPQRILLGGFSQGSGMAIYTALKGNLAARGFIGIGTWWEDASDLAVEGKDVRGYFITGERDHTLDRAREIHEVLRRNNVPFGEETHPELGHDFSADFGSSFDKAIEFIFKEQE